MCDDYHCPSLFNSVHNVNGEAVLGLDIQDRRPTVLPLGVLSISFSTVRRRHTRNEAR